MAPSTSRPGAVAALCDRDRGIGADGVLRVVRSTALAEVAEPADDVEWFMDYRNADGSVAEMCGNGVRVFARYLVDAAGSRTASCGSAPAAGSAPCTSRTTDVAVEMGPARVEGEAKASVDGQLFPGLMVNIGNPHLACVVDVPLAAIDLTRPPGHDPALFPHGGERRVPHPMAKDRIAMRVYERGVGETRSCGTGTVAAVVAARGTQAAPPERSPSTHPVGRCASRSTRAPPRCRGPPSWSRTASWTRGGGTARSDLVARSGEGARGMAACGAGGAGSTASSPSSAVAQRTRLTSASEEGDER